MRAHASCVVHPPTCSSHPSRVARVHNGTTVVAELPRQSHMHACVQGTVITVVVAVVAAFVWHSQHLVFLPRCYGCHLSNSPPTVMPWLPGIHRLGRLPPLLPYESYARVCFGASQACLHCCAGGTGGTGGMGSLPLALSKRRRGMGLCPVRTRGPQQRTSKGPGCRLCFPCVGSSCVPCDGLSPVCLLRLRFVAMRRWRSSV